MSFRLTPATAITAGNLTSNVVETPPAAYDVGATYAEGDQVSVFGGVSNTEATLYESLIDGNTGNTPASSPDEWTPIGTAYLAWNSGTGYAQGAIVSDLANHKLYESNNVATNTNHALTDANWWLELGPTNRWAMVDDQIDTQTQRPESIRVEVALTGRVDTLGLLNVDASSVNVTLLKDDVEVYNRDFSMISYLGITNYWEHHFYPVTRRRTLFVSDLPIITGLTLVVTISNPGSNAAIGHMVVGRGRDFGETLIGASLGFLDFSKYQSDADFGTRSVVRRGFKKQGDFEVWVKKGYVDLVYNMVTSFRGKPTLIAASEEYGSAIYYGLITSAKITIEYHEYSILRITVEDF